MMIRGLCPSYHLQKGFLKMKRNNKMITSIVALAVIITTAIIMSDVTANIKMFMFILTIPFAAGIMALVIADRIDLCNEISENATSTLDIEPVVPDDDDIKVYVDEWVELLHLDEIDEVYAARMKRNHQIQNIHQEIREMAMEADKRIAELCGIC